MEHRPALFKGADMAENLFQHLQRLGCVLSNPAGVMGIRAVRDKTPLTEVSDIALVHYAPTRAMVSSRVVQNTIVDCLYICATRHKQQDVINQILENRRVADFLRSSD